MKVLTYTHSSGSSITGLEDGGITFQFPDHPAHHRIPGVVEVSFGPKTLKRMRKLSKRASRKFQREFKQYLKNQNT